MKTLPNRWDIIYLGTVGFAQVGTDTYKAKAAIERQIMTAFFTESDQLKVPLKFHDKAYFYWNLCPHDFGSYYDFQIAYDRDTIDDWEDDDEMLQDYAEFWDWANNCENAINQYEEEITVLCNELYRNAITMEVVHKRIEDKNEGLKVV
jgi:hypothetical protein